MIGLPIYFLTSLFMIDIGIAQLKSKDPVGFYSGEKPPKKEALTDVAAWNRKYGRMWVVYGAVILLSFFGGAAVGDSLRSVVPMLGGVLCPIPFMIRYHHILLKRYRRRSIRPKNPESRKTRLSGSFFFERAAFFLKKRGFVLFLLFA